MVAFLLYRKNDENKDNSSNNNVFFIPVILCGLNKVFLIPARVKERNLDAGCLLTPTNMKFFALYNLQPSSLFILNHAKNMD
jgi:hypothetical protein